MQTPGITNEDTERQIDQMIRQLFRIRKRLERYKYNTEMRGNLYLAEAKLVELLIERDIYVDHDNNRFKFSELHGAHRRNILEKYQVHYIVQRNL